MLNIIMIVNHNNSLGETCGYNIQNMAYNMFYEHRKMSGILG